MVHTTDSSQTVPKELKIKPASILRTLTEFLVDRVDRRKFNGVIIGISGGVDSAVSAAIAVHALGADRVTAVFMPYKESDPKSEKDASALAERLGFEFVRQPLTSFADSLFTEVGVTSPVRRGNVLARLRMIVLFDWSHRTGRLVLGTSNKTEILLGYGTWYGDVACSINALGDLYKTQVRQMARHLKIPRGIITKPPSADLWPGQTDEGELGLTYAMADRILYRLYDLGMTAADLTKEGFDSRIVRQIIKRVERNRFKSMTPEIAQLNLS
jgi:NAD+ synthase